MNEESLIHKGHRERMRERLIMHGSRVMQSYELLEMLLYYVIPYKNTNPTAKRLMLRFGSLDGIFTASREELCEVEGVGDKVADFLISVSSLISEYDSVPDVKAFDDYCMVGEFLAEKLSSVKEHKCIMMLFDNRMNLIDCGFIYDLDYSSGAVRADAFISYAIKRRAAVAVTAHNHPHGPLFPTVGDMATNSSITAALNLAGITHLEHYIVCGNKYFGISKEISLSLIQSPELERFYLSRERKQNERSFF